MLVTLVIARCATPVRSGMPPVTGTRRPARAAGCGAGCGGALAGGAHPTGHDEAGEERHGHEKREDGNSSNHHRTSILRAGGRVAFGSVIVSTPLVRSADTASMSIFDANSNVRANEPWPRSTWWNCKMSASGRAAFDRAGRGSSIANPRVPDRCVRAQAQALRPRRHSDPGSRTRRSAVSTSPGDDRSIARVVRARRAGHASGPRTYLLIVSGRGRGD